LVFHSNFSSIFTRFTDIAAFVPLFPTPPLVFSKFPLVDGLRATKSKGVGLIVHALVSKISNLCGPDPLTSQTDRPTDRRMADRRHAIAILRSAL